MGFQAEATAAKINVAEVVDALRQLAGSAGALVICIEDRDYSHQVLVSEVTRIRTLVGLISSAFSVLALHTIVHEPRGAPDDENRQAP